MPKCIISLGSIKKKLFIPLLYIILYIFINIYHDYIAEDSEEFDIVTLYIEGFGTTISEVMIFFIGNAFRYTNKRKLMKKLTKQNYLKDLSILFILTVFYMANTLSPFYLKEEGEKKDDTSRELYIIDAIELIFITIATHFFLKYNYYIHHIISIIIIVILCLINDIILQNFTHTNIYVVISSITLILADSSLRRENAASEPYSEIVDITEASITATAIPIVSYQSYLEKINNNLIANAIKRIFIIGSPKDSKNIFKTDFFLIFVNSLVPYFFLELITSFSERPVLFIIFPPIKYMDFNSKKELYNYLFR